MVNTSLTSRPRTSEKSPSPEETALPSIPEGNGKTHPPRRSSLGFLRRAKSGETLNGPRSVSGGKLTKKQQRITEERREREAAAIAREPPKLPDFALPPQLRTFGAEDVLSDSEILESNRAVGYHRRFMPRGSMETTGSTMHHDVPVPPIPSDSPSGQNGEHVDRYARTESMTHRGRYSYASSAVSTINSPRRVRRRKDPTPFNILVIGARSSGKTSFLNFLRTSLALPPRKQRQARANDDIDADPLPPSSGRSNNFTSHYLETEIDGERIGLTLWDSQGLEKGVVDLQLREMSIFLESKFEDTFAEEMKVVRAPGIRDTHIHCVFLVLDPLRLDANVAAAQATSNGATNGGYTGDKPSRSIGGLDEDLDLQVLRTLQGKTTVVPVISKADTITTAHMAFLKKTVSDSLKKANIDPLEALGLDDFEGETSTDRLDERDEDAELAKKPAHIHHDELSSSPSTSNSDTDSPPKSKRPATHVRTPSSLSQTSPTSPETPYLPLSVISPDIYDTNAGPGGKVGRKFPWGFADPYNVEHCDFLRLKEAVFTEWRGELREASRELWYEGWRTSRLNTRAGWSDGRL
ncbi:MAG: hypothetical protein M1830_002675 [Pleopsidium flavum]|nr:MAG: hypothetical protein M1830_002675 [Pleopsidium flavum]